MIFQAVYERGFMEGEIDVFDYVLAEGLHMTIADMQERMPNSEYVGWRAFYVYRQAMQDLAFKEMR